MVEKGEGGYWLTEWRGQNGLGRFCVIKMLAVVRFTFHLAHKFYYRNALSINVAYIYFLFLAISFRGETVHCFDTSITEVHICEALFPIL